MRPLWCAICRGVAWALPFASLQASRIQGTQTTKGRDCLSDSKNGGVLNVNDKTHGDMVKRVPAGFLWLFRACLAMDTP